MFCGRSAADASDEFGELVDGWRAEGAKPGGENPVRISFADCKSVGTVTEIQIGGMPFAVFHNTENAIRADVTLGRPGAAKGRG